MHLQLWSQVRRPRALSGLRAWRTRWARVGLLALLAAGLATGVAFAAGDPEWFGSRPVRVSDSPLPEARQPAVGAGPSGSVLVAWSDVHPGRDIHVALSGDGGWTWSAPQVVAATGGQSQLPDVLIVGDRTWVAWADKVGTIDPTFTIYEAERDAGSGIWVTRSVAGSSSDASTRPSLAASPGRLHLAFHAGPEATSSILYTARWFTETAWSAPVVVVTSTATTGLWYPSVAVSPDGARVHLVWEERVILTGMRRIKYLSGTLNGEAVSWSWPPAELSSGITNSRWPDVAADSHGGVHVVWGEYVDIGVQSEQYVRYARYDAAGGSWTMSKRVDRSPVKVNEANPTDIAPRLVLDPGGGQMRLCVVWHGYRFSPAAEEVLLSCSQNGGASWEPPMNVSRTVEADDMSILPGVAFDTRGKLHVAWQERDGPDPVYDYQVYYARSPEVIYVPTAARRYRYLPYKTRLPLVARDWRPLPKRAYMPLVMRSH